MKRLLWPVLLLGLAGSATTGIVRADDDEAGNRVSFQVEAGREVRNDRMTVVMKVTVEDRKPARLAGSINETMSWALEQARPVTVVKAQSGSYRTWPVYDDRKIVRWRGQQELWLESGDSERLSALVGVLQSRLEVQSMQFSVSPEQRQEVMDELIAEALAAFRQRAELVRKSLGADGYELDEVSINSRGRPPANPRRMDVAMMADAAGAPPPAVESGTSRVTVSVSGSIRLE